MAYKDIEMAIVEAKSSLVSFKLQRKTVTRMEIVHNKFPVVMKPKIKFVPKGGHQFVNFTEKSSTLPTSMVYAPQDEIARPRNKFIIARSVLSKPVKISYGNGTEDVSKIISMIWQRNQHNFQSYFKYLSSLETEWHDSYFPLYHYHPKKKSYKQLEPINRPKLKEGFSSVIFMNEDDDLSASERSTSPVIEVARDIDDISKYIDLCSSTMNPMFEKRTQAQRKQQMSYKDGTLKFSINKPTRAKRPNKRACKVTPNDKIMQQLFASFKSPMYGER